MIVAMAVNTDGRREVLGMTIGNSEAETVLDRVPALARRGEACAASSWSSPMRMKD